MKNTLLSLAVGGALLFGAASTGAANPVERACNASGRQAATPALCDCVGRVARATLSWSDQRTAAKFFSDPHRAQEVRQSARESDEEFWQRYKAFGALAEQTCAR